MVCGKVVSVNRDRKVPKGTVGIVFWTGNNGYGESVGIMATDGAKHFTAMSNVDVITATTEQQTQLASLQAASLAEWKAANPRPERTRTNDYSPSVKRLYARRARW